MEQWGEAQICYVSLGFSKCRKCFPAICGLKPGVTFPERASSHESQKARAKNGNSGGESSPHVNGCFSPFDSSPLSRSLTAFRKDENFIGLPNTKEPQRDQGKKQTKKSESAAI